MSSDYDIHRDRDRLTLTKSLGDRITSTGCLLFFGAFASITAIGLLSLMQDVSFVDAGGRDAPQDDARFFHPRYNHFGYFWAVGSLLMLFLVPFYVVRAHRSSLVFCFDRTSGLFSRNGKPVAALARIEYVWIRETRDPDDAYLYLLLIVYSDGHELLIDNSYDERRIVNLAKEVAAFLDVRMVWK
jgi:hypothetical protein